MGAAGLFLVAMTLLHWGWYQHALILDTVEYHRYGDAMASGHVPYRDFAVEYPPGALPVFGLPAVGRPSFSFYNREFEVLMALCGVGALAAMAVALRALGASLQRTAAALAFFALAPLALGSVDPLPLRPLAGGVDRRRAGRGARAAGAARLRGARPRRGGEGLSRCRRAARRSPTCGGRVAGARRCSASVSRLRSPLVVIVPFLALAPHGVWASIERQTTRPLQIESLASAILLAAHHVGGLALTIDSSHGSQNLSGPLPDALGTGSSVLLALVLVGLWVAAARGRATPDRLIRYSAASLAAFVTLGKVLSPQFLIWLLPIVPLVRGRRGLAASALLGLALLLTQVWFPIRYFDLVAFETFPVVAAAGARSRARRAAGGAHGTGTRTGSQLSARPAASHSTSAPSIRTPPSAGSKRTRHPGAHPPDRELGLDADHRVVRARSCPRR